MSHVARLGQLLRGFRLGSGASVVELRQSYRQEAKRLHPDGRPDADHRDFVDLRERFEEALELIGRRDKPGAHRFSEFAAAAAATSASARPAEQAVPSRGLSAQLVYATAGSLLCMLGLSFCFGKESTEQPKQLAPASSVKVAPTRKPCIDKEETLSRDLAAYFSAKARRTATRGAGSPRVEPQMRDGVALSAFHVAAQDNRVWWIERCGALDKCRHGLNGLDRRGDTPLHHCAQFGHMAACRTLLRLGAESSMRNKWRLLPEDLADDEQLAALLRAARIRHHEDDAKSLFRMALCHPDGLGFMTAPPAELFVEAPCAFESLRHSINLATGREVLWRLALTRVDPLLLGPESPEAPHAQNPPACGTSEAVECALEQVRSALEGTNIDLARRPVLRTEAPWHAGAGRRVQGLLVFESAAQVTPDAPGHWFALRRCSDGSLWRLDPVRGPFRLSNEEFDAVLDRYVAWRIVSIV